ncbi:MAG: FHA domain-containing protein [Candidatus Xenobia bacterium]
MKCSVCGSDNLEGSAYCEDCGAKLPVGGAAPRPPVPVAVAPAPMPPPMQPPTPMMPQVATQPPAMMPPRPVAPSGPTVTCACGAVNPASEQYCHDCGANLRAGAVGGSAPVSFRTASTAKLRATQYGRDFSLDREVTQAGRRSPADGIEPEIDLTPMDPDSYASRRHARIMRQGEQYLLEDLGSSNGTFLNTARLEKGVEHPLKEGDKVRFGKTEFVFSLQ